MAEDWRVSITLMRRSEAEVVEDGGAQIEGQRTRLLDRTVHVLHTRVDPGRGAGLPRHR